MGGAPPSWIRHLDLGPIFTVTPASMKDGELPSEVVQTVYGPNMAIRASIFASGVRFDSSIGPNGSNYAMGSETELVMRLSREGHRAWFVPEAVVAHLVRPEQLQKGWALKRATRWGRGILRISWCSQKLWLGIPRHLFRDIPKETASVLGAAIFFRQGALLRARWRFNVLWGMAIESRLLVREMKAPQPSSSLQDEP